WRPRSASAQGVPDPSSDVRDPRAAPACDLFLVRDIIRQLVSRSCPARGSTSSSKGSPRPDRSDSIHSSSRPTGYVLHMVVHAYHRNIIQYFVCVYLRSMTQYVRSDCCMADGKEEPTILFKDEAYSAQDLYHPRIAENWRGSVMSKSGGVMCVVLFFFTLVLSQLGFPGKVLMRQH
uniref:Uncharacterized protein n=1 Tax=Brassica oleracea var. oleracea TaxID=109376 RepID=A0A0D3APZ1_BRAOL